MTGTSAHEPATEMPSGDAAGAPPTGTRATFEVHGRCTETRARTGVLTLSHGTVQTPVFMPVGTLASVKSLAPRTLEDLGAEIILANTYHLYLRPGHDLVAQLGGLNRFMGWNRPTLTDSGGFQVFSMRELCTVTDDGVGFASHVDGSRHLFTPEISIAVQQALGADIAMVFDECLPHPSDRDTTARSLARSQSWAHRSRAAHTRPDQALFGIVQGGFEMDLRREAAQEAAATGYDGYAIGGVSVGEDKALMHEVMDVVVPHLPDDAPHYLMGVGLPIDLIEGVARGIDMFDCVMPTRHARTGSLFVGAGRINIKNARFRDDANPVDADCSCYTCGHFSRAYLRHLFVTGEILGHHLNTIHNLHHYLSWMRTIRAAINAGRFAALYRDTVARAHEESCHV